VPKYKYKARDSSGAPLNGELVARSETDAAKQLRAEGIFVVRLDKLKEQSVDHPEPVRIGGRRVKHDEIIYFTNQLAGMVDTGVPITDALEATIDGTGPGAFRSTIEDVIQRVQSGSDLSSALAAHPKVFPDIYIHMVRASETTGTLGSMLCRIANYMTGQREIKKKIKGALTYPLVMIVFAIGATIFLLTFVLPKFAGIYSSKQALLPLPTQLLLDTSQWIISHWGYLLCVIIFVMTGTILFFRTPRGRYTADWLRLNMPVLKHMFRMACIARALRTLGAMISAGVSVLEAVLITRDVVGNRLFGQVFEHAHDRLEQGEQLSQSLLEAPYIPRSIWQMLSAGERTGQLGPAMERVADMCETDLKHSVRMVTQFIEPAMILIMGIIIGGIALAMLLPIFQISKVMTQG